MKYAHNMQNESSDCGIAVVQTILQRFNFDVGQLHLTLKKVIADGDQKSEVQGLSLLDIQDILLEYGIESDSYEVDDLKELTALEFPSVLMVDNEGMPHYCVVHSMKEGQAIVSDPSKSKVEKITLDYLEEKFMGYAVCIDKIQEMENPLRKKQESYPRLLLREAIESLPFSQKIIGITMFIVSVFVPILATYFLEFILGNYLEIVDGQFLLFTVALMFSMSVVYFSMMKFNTLFKISLSNRVEQIVLQRYFDNKLENIHSKANIDNLTGYFWNIMIAVNGLLEKLYFGMNLLFTSILIAVLANSSIVLAGLLLSWTGVFFIVSRPLVAEIRAGNKQYIADSNAFSSSFESSIRTTMDIKLFQKKASAKENFNKRMSNYFKSTLYVGQKETAIYSLMEITRILMVTTYFIIYINQYINGNLNILSAFGSGIYVLYIATGGLNSVFASYLEYVKSKDAIEYIETRNDFAKEVDQSLIPLVNEKINEIQMTRVAYDVDGVSLFAGVEGLLEAGQSYCVTGANGSGKSTLIKLISGLIENQQGHFLVNGKQKYTDLSKTTIGDHLSFYSTEMEVYQQTIKNNILYHCFTDEQNLTETQVRYKDELGLELSDDYLVNSSGTNLSQGQKQKLLLLRTLNREADIYIFDEPTGNLDKKSENNFIQIISELTKEKNKIVLIVSHNENVINCCDNVYNLGSKEEEL